MSKLCLAKGSKQEVLLDGSERLKRGSQWQDLRGLCFEDLHEGFLKYGQRDADLTDKLGCSVLAAQRTWS